MQIFKREKSVFTHQKADTRQIWAWFNRLHLHSRQETWLKQGGTTITLELGTLDERFDNIYSSYERAIC